MHADAWFCRGGGHAVGQDYARAGVTADGRVYALVADGCSSSPDTDCGARLLVLAAVAALEQGVPVAELGPVAVARAAEAAAGLLSPLALDATLLAVVAAPGGPVELAAFGDGVLFGVRADGAIEAWPIEQGGLPTYPSYGLDAGRLASLRRVLSPVDPAGCDPLEPTVRALDPAAWRLVGVASDGLSAFRAGAGLVPVADVLAHVTDVRVPAGRFVERSSTFFLRRTCPRLGWTPGDDYSVGALWLGGSP